MRTSSRSTGDEKPLPTTAYLRALLVPKSFQNLADIRAAPLLLGSPATSPLPGSTKEHSLGEFTWQSVGIETCDF